MAVCLSGGRHPAHLQIAYRGYPPALLLFIHLVDRCPEEVPAAAPCAPACGLTSSRLWVEIGVLVAVVQAVRPCAYAGIQANLFDLRRYAPVPELYLKL